MRTLLTLFSIAVTGVSGAAPCTAFEDQPYCLVWASVNGPVTSNEYLRAGETVERWEKMITFKEYAGTSKVKDVAPGYMKNVRPFMALKAEVFASDKSSHGEDIVIVLVLLAPDKSHYEYVLHRMVSDEGKPVRSVIYSLRLPFAEQIDFTPVMKALGARLEALFAIEPVTYASIPIEPSNQPLEPTR